MASPVIDPHRPLGDEGLRILAEVAGLLTADPGSKDVLSRVASVLARGLGSDYCRIWIRTPDGAAFTAVVGGGSSPPDLQEADPISRLIREPPEDRRDGADWVLRRPLVHGGQHLGLLEARVPDGPAAGTLQRVVGIVANIISPLLAAVELSEDLASEVALRTREIDAQRRFTSKIIDSLPVGLYVVDRQYRIQAWNRKRETGTQGVDRDDALGRPVFEVLHRQPQSLLSQEFDRVFATGQMEQLEVESRATGEPRHYRITKIPMRLDDDQVSHVITIGEDITDWKWVQQQGSQTEKLAAVGQMAAGVMHEINNPLATIGACVEALFLRSEDLLPSDQAGIDEYLRIIESELERCKSIVDGLLDFSRPKARAKRNVEVNQIVEDALFLVKHHGRFKGIRLVRRLGDGLPTIESNAEQLIQVFLSLMMNAIDAMEGAGVLTVHTGVGPGPDEVFVEFTDTGMGIPREDLPKIFEPFYTTKQPGRGTGLGLSICYGIVQEHDGRIDVRSKIGRGSVFTVTLPVRQDEERG